MGLPVLTATALPPTLHSRRGRLGEAEGAQQRLR